MATSQTLTKEMEVLREPLCEHGKLSHAEWLALIAAVEEDKSCSSVLDYLVQRKALTTSSAMTIRSNVNGYATIPYSMIIKPLTLPPDVVERAKEMDLPQKEMDLPQEEEAPSGEPAQPAEVSSSEADAEAAPERAKAHTVAEPPTPDMPEEEEASDNSNEPEAREENEQKEQHDLPDDNAPQVPVFKDETEEVDFSDAVAPHEEPSEKEEPPPVETNERSPEQETTEPPESSADVPKTVRRPVTSMLSPQGHSEALEDSSPDSESRKTTSRPVSELVANQSASSPETSYSFDDTGLSGEIDMNDLEIEVFDDDGEDSTEVEQVSSIIGMSAAEIQEILADAFRTHQTSRNKVSGPDTTTHNSVAIAPMPDTGKSVGGYKLLEKIGRGDMALTFRSHDQARGQAVAVKVFRAMGEISSPKWEEVYRKEAKALQSFNHPNAVGLLDFGVQDRLPYLVSPLMARSLEDQVEGEGTLNSRKLALVGYQIADALEAATAKRLLHWAIKPSNIYLGRNDVAQLGDFALASLLWPRGRSSDGRLCGSPPYMPPEMIKNSSAADLRSDMYAFGATLYYAAAGFPPVFGDNYGETLRMQLEEIPAPIAEIVIGFDEQLGSLIMRLLEKSPKNRCESWAEVKSALGDILRFYAERSGLRGRKDSQSSPILKPSSATKQRMAEERRKRQRERYNLIKIPKDLFESAKNTTKPKKQSLSKGGKDFSNLAGTLLNGQFRLERLLGTGGGGTVYEATDLKLDAKIAVKLLIEQDIEGDDSLLQGFKDEIKMAWRINHDNVLRTHGFHEWEGIFYLYMEYFPGITLHELLATTGPMPLKLGLGIVRQVVRGVNAAHQKNVVHKDIKPGNILVNRNGFAKILDFGIAQMASGQVHDRHKGLFMGTPAYASPEQCRGHAVDRRSDIYSLGVLMHEIFTGALPFIGEVPQIVMGHVAKKPPPVRSIRKELPQALEEIILTCLAKAPEKRFRSAGGLYHALGRINEV